IAAPVASGRKSVPSTLAQPANSRLPAATRTATASIATPVRAAASATHRSLLAFDAAGVPEPRHHGGGASQDGEDRHEQRELVGDLQGPAEGVAADRALDDE